MTFWVYILRCADGSYYTGHTDNLDNRIGQHTRGAIPTCYTFKRRPVTLAFSQEFVTREEALTSEQQLKGWSRKKKEAMMRGDWAEVSRLAHAAHAVPATSVHSGLPPSTCAGPSLPVCPESSLPVRPKSSPTARPELVEGRSPNTPEPRSPSVHPSIIRQAHDSGRTEGDGS